MQDDASSYSLQRTRTGSRSDFEVEARVETYRFIFIPTLCSIQNARTNVTNFECNPEICLWKMRRPQKRPRAEIYETVRSISQFLWKRSAFSPRGGEDRAERSRRSWRGASRRVGVTSGVRSGPRPYPGAVKEPPLSAAVNLPNMQRGSTESDIQELPVRI